MQGATGAVAVLLSIMPLAAEKAVAGEGGELCLARVDRIHVHVRLTRGLHIPLVHPHYLGGGTHQRKLQNLLYKEGTESTCMQLGKQVELMCLLLLRGLRRSVQGRYMCG